MTAGLPEWAQVTEERRGHIGRVVRVLREWAAAMDVPAIDRDRWMRAAFLHDALKDAPIEQLRQLAPRAWDSDALRHGPAAAEMASRHGETDPAVLDAVRYHSVGFAGWDTVGRMLYLADFLEPGRTGKREERRRLREAVPEDPHRALWGVAAARLHLTIEKGHPLLSETVEFWNALPWPDD